MIVVSHLIAFPFFSLILSALVSVCVTLVMLSLDYYVLSITGLESLKVFCGYTLKVALWFFFFLLVNLIQLCYGLLLCLLNHYIVLKKKLCPKEMLATTTQTIPLRCAHFTPDLNLTQFAEQNSLCAAPRVIYQGQFSGVSPPPEAITHHCRLGLLQAPQPGVSPCSPCLPRLPALPGVPAPSEQGTWKSRARSQQKAIFTPLIKFTTIITYWHETSWAQPQPQRRKIGSCTNMEQNKQIIHNRAKQRLHRVCLLSQMQTHRNTFKQRDSAKTFLWKTCPGWCTGCSRWKNGIWVDVRVQQKAEAHQWMVLLLAS